MNKENSKNRWNPYWIPIFAALITGIIATCNSIYISNQNLKLERKQFESNLILKLILPEDTAQSINNIKFFLEAGFLSEENKKVFPLIPKYQLKLPSRDTVFNSPKNEYQVNLYDFLSAQVIGESNEPLSEVEIKINKNRHLLNDTTFFSRTISDSNGLFKIPLPPDQNMIKVTIIKDGYLPMVRIYSKRGLKNLKFIKLQKR